MSLNTVPKTTQLMIKKVLRFIRIYGFSKTLYKGIARTQIKFFQLNRKSKKGCDIGVIGCGHFTSAIIGYTIRKEYGNRFVDSYDISFKAKKEFEKLYSINSSSTSASDLINNDKVKYVFVASNHATHTDYAVEALAAGNTVYIEKPISVSRDQLVRLNRAVKKANKNIYAGFNRPFAPAIRDLKKYIVNRNSPITLNCFITCHNLPPDNWYRNPEEGTRICGNVCHWLDLAVHILSWGKLPDKWNIQLSVADATSMDDNIAISMTSSEGDLIVIVITSRSEPFEGINESINLQHDKTICKIDDFRKMTVWQEDKLINKSYWPKDVGHKHAILQPFQKKSYRDWNEINMSTLLMLHITDMVKSGETNNAFSFRESMNQLKDDIKI